MSTIDNGFRQLFDASLPRDYSRLYENLALLHLRRKGPEFCYFQQKQEVDFYTCQDGKHLVNVSYTIDDTVTFNREITALMEGMKYFNLEKSYLITAAREEVTQTKAGEVLVFPMRKGLLSWIRVQVKAARIGKTGRMFTLRYWPEARKLPEQGTSYREAAKYLKGLSCIFVKNMT